MVGSWKGAIKVKYDLVLAKARADGDTATVKQLEASGPPDPKDANKVFGFNDRVYPLWAPSDVAWIKSLRADGPRLEAAYPKDFKDFEDGFSSALKRPCPTRSRPTCRRRPAGSGRPSSSSRDRAISSPRRCDAVDYFNHVKAPYKKLVIIPDAGHFAFMTSPQLFLAALTEEVRPVAISRGA